MLFDNLSPKTDFSSKLTILEIRLDVINKNVLYITHECDKILKLVKSLSTNRDLQQQVDQYFERDETSPQTDQDEQ